MKQRNNLHTCYNFYVVIIFKAVTLKTILITSTIYETLQLAVTKNISSCSVFSVM